MSEESDFEIDEENKLDEINGIPTQPSGEIKDMPQT
jgi:hypothetical protein